MSDQSNSKSKRSILRSPMTNVIVSFLLTSVIGTAITQFYFDRRQHEQLRVAQQQNRKEALTLFTQHMMENQIRAERLIEAMKTAAESEDASKAKDAHEESWIAWRREKPRVLLLVKDLLSLSQYERFREILESRLEQGMIVPMRRCLHGGFAQARASGRVDELLEGCGTKGHDEKLLACIEALFNELHEISAAESGIKNEIGDERRAELAKRVDQACTTEPW